MRRGLRACLPLLALVGLPNCGGGPATSDGQGVVLHGVIVGSASRASIQTSSTASPPAISVSLRGSATVSTTVAADDSFTLRGLPSGAFTVVFASGHDTMGTLDFTDVISGEEMSITVSVTASSVTLIEEDRDGIGRGEIEIQGRVAAILVFDPGGESRFMIESRTVVVRPGQSTIREGHTPRTVNDLTRGQLVHVTGTWLPMEGSTQPVLAQDVVLQGGDQGGANSTCLAPGAHAEVEGPIMATSSSSITVRQQGLGNFLCLVSDATRIHKANTTFTLGQLATGTRVHVRGKGLGSAGSVCQIDAEEVKVQ